MIGKSIYVADNPAFVGGSPQSIHEQLWAQGLRRRLQVRGAIAAAALVIGTWVLSLWWGLLLALVAAGADALWHWRKRAAESVWRKGQRGERRTARILRAFVEPRGFRVLHGRNIPGRGQLDHLVIGSTGVLLIENRAVPPETEIAEYGGTLYVDERPGKKMAAEFRETARLAAEMLGKRLDGEVPVEPVLVVYGGDLRRGRVSAEGITMLRAHRLPHWIRNRRIRYTPEEIAAIYEAAHSLPISRQALIVR
ncbi:nuclease-related domain-containing protein [Actinomadura sp. DC4]|uniref:nuclease-related domain-containing protein n=1 Tax=Actinomadura sp. DC4 TaxID=3055069 RepID=UPI0025AEF142|nr:nuclease-related domain-containing protein [Actinomadura sp. DC4]MDN3356182.1 nuclease-related domain-containing protein [Actinomadura sp. DC4]